MTQDAGPLSRGALVAGGPDDPQPWSGSRWAWLVPLLAIAAISFCAWWGISYIESKVESAAPVMLRDAGIDPTGLTFDATYRNIDVGGTLPVGVSAERVALVLSESSGPDGEDIRSVSVAAEPFDDATPLPTPSSPTDPGDPVEPPAPVEPAPAPLPPGTVLVTYDGATMVLRGRVSTSDEAAALRTSAASVVGETQVLDSLEVGGDGPPSEHIAVLANTLTTFGNLSRASATLSPTNLDIEGAALDRKDRRPTQAALDDARELGLVTDTDLAIEPANGQERARQTVALAAELETLQAEVDETVVFTSSSTTLSPAARATLDKVVDAMRRYDQPVVEIGGHTDTDGSDGFNLQLSQTRADAVLDYMISQGVTPSRLTAVGYGEGQLLTDDSTEAGKRQNRRVEFLAKETF